jgi:Protein of unknown function (DUF3433)
VIQNKTTTGQLWVDILPLVNSSHQLIGLSSWRLTEGFLSAIDYGSQLVDDEDKSYKDSVTPNGVRSLNVEADAFFGLVIAASPDVPLSAYLHPRILTRASQRTFRFLAARIAHRDLMSSRQHVIEGNFSDHVDRIIFQELPLRSMQGLLSAAILMIVIVGILMPLHTLPASANSISCYISVFERSEPVIDLLKESSIWTLNRIRQDLSFYGFQAGTVKVGGRFQFRILLSKRPPTDRIRRKISKRSEWHLSRKKWWRPFAFGLPAISFILLTPPTMIAILEVLSQRSQKNEGLLDIESENYYRYAWLFIPTLLVVLLATLFNMLDYEIENIHPFQRLRRQAATAESSILNNPLSNLTPLVVWDAICFRDIALGAAGVSVMLAPFLPIVMSGLYTHRDIERHQQVQVQQISWFQNLSLGLQTDNMTLVTLLALISQQNLTYPQWTYNEIALPHISLMHSGYLGKTERFENAKSLTMQVPGLRGTMDCSVLPESQMNMTENATSGYYKHTLHFNVSTGPESPIQPFDEPYAFDIFLKPWSSTRGYFGQFFRTRAAIGDTSNRLLLPFGYVEHNHSKAISYLLCTPYTEQLEVDLKLILPSYAVSLTHPPTAIESSAHFFSNDSFIPSNIPSLLGYDSGSLEGFFQILMYGKDGVPGDELLSNTTRLLEAVEHQYRIFAAQAFNIAYRTSFGSAENRNRSRILNATLISTSSRLIQSKISTRILQGLLAALFICAVITYTILWKTTNGTRCVLPHNPASIAIMATLLAGSKMLTTEKLNIPPGTEFMNEKEMKKSGVFDGWLFSLGWWETSRPGVQRFGIDIGRAGQERDENA